MKSPTLLKFQLGGAVWLLCAGFCCFNAKADAVSGTALSVAGTVAFDRNDAFGWRFTPMTDMDITALGFFDATSLPTGNETGLSRSHDVGIYRVSDQVLIASTTIPMGSGASLNANFRYVALPKPVRLAGFALSASPDPAATASNWTMASRITYANSPLPTVFNPTSDNLHYLVSAHGNPPPVLAFPRVAQTGLLPVFAADFQFTLVLPLLAGVEIRSNAVVIDVTNLTVGVTNCVEKSADLNSLQPLQNIVPGASATNLNVDTVADTIAIYRIKVVL